MTVHAATRFADGGSLDDVPAGVNPEPHRRARGSRGHRLTGEIAAIVLALVAGVAGAGELLVGAMPDGNGARVDFGLEAESREAVVGEGAFSSGRPDTRSPGSAGSD